MDRVAPDTSGGSYLVAMNPEKQTIGCAIVQAALGGTIPNSLLSMFEWDTSVVGMRLYQVERDVLERAAKRGGND